MRLQNIPNTTMVKPVFLPQFYEGGSTAVLIIHGYTGAPFEMSYLAERLNKAGFTVSVPRLPGHGTNGRDFLESGWKDWLRACVDAYLNLKAYYKTVYITGLSMGGVLTILLAAKFKPEKIILFGSRAWGSPQDDSDVDLLIVMESNHRAPQRSAEISMECRPPFLPMDILVRTPNSNTASR